jgi:hypothetical protein
MLSQSAQKGIPEGRVFELNSQRLDAVGTVTLQDMLDRRDWTGLPQYSAFALNKGSKTSSGIKQGAGAGGGGEGDSDGDAEAEMDVRKGMEAYYRRSGSGGVSEEVKGVERRSNSDSGDDDVDDDDMSYRSPGRNVRFEEEIDVRREIGGMNNGYSLFNLNEQEEEEVEVEVEVEQEVEVDGDMSLIKSSDISNFSEEDAVIEEEGDVYDSAAIEVEEEMEVEVETEEEEEEDFSSLLSDVDKWLSEN